MTVATPTLLVGLVLSSCTHAYSSLSIHHHAHPLRRHVRRNVLTTAVTPPSTLSTPVRQRSRRPVDEEESMQLQCPHMQVAPDGSETHITVRWVLNSTAWVVIEDGDVKFHRKPTTNSGKRIKGRNVLRLTSNGGRYRFDYDETLGDFWMEIRPVLYKEDHGEWTCHVSASTQADDTYSMNTKQIVRSPLPGEAEQHISGFQRQQRRDGAVAVYRLTPGGGSRRIIPPHLGGVPVDTGQRPPRPVPAEEPSGYTINREPSGWAAEENNVVFSRQQLDESRSSQSLRPARTRSVHQHLFGNRAAVHLTNSWALLIGVSLLIGYPVRQNSYTVL